MLVFIFLAFLIGTISYILFVFYFDDWATFYTLIFETMNYAYSLLPASLVDTNSYLIKIFMLFAKILYPYIVVVSFAASVSAFYASYTLGGCSDKTTQVNKLFWLFSFILLIIFQSTKSVDLSMCISITLILFRSRPTLTCLILTILPIPFLLILNFGWSFAFIYWCIILLCNMYVFKK